MGRVTQDGDHATRFVCGLPPRPYSPSPTDRYSSIGSGIPAHNPFVDVTPPTRAARPLILSLTVMDKRRSPASCAHRGQVRPVRPTQVVPIPAPPQPFPVLSPP